MNFKLINEFDGDLHHQLYEFFKKSKPMNFCSIASPTIRNKKTRPENTKTRDSRGARDSRVLVYL